ncbi:peptidoglycan-binding domain-containing protein [Bacillus sp. UNCCL81]|uniref:peptidoglycan-binding domain-containing protein n=1 Tax=Bacillus sp. UNCCL81 TaxID=1502755 RepID=UPI00041DA9A5|nr:peptidoglycan-binding domain-containing protein [Bacillus sp. UNCCL81]
MGSKGKDVERIQRAVKVQVTGVYDEVTRKEVKENQERKGLKVDGVVSQQTWSKIF